MSTFDYSRGATVEITLKVYKNRVLTDPGQVTLKVRDPGGVQTNHVWPTTDLVRDRTGVFHYDQLFNAPGEWVVRFETTSPAPGVTPDDTYSIDPTVMV